MRNNFGKHKLRWLTLALAVFVLTTTVLPSAAYADDIASDKTAQTLQELGLSSIGFAVDPSQTAPRPEIMLLANTITDEMVALSTEYYNNLLSCDPDMFLFNDNGIKGFGFWGYPTASEYSWLKSKAASVTKGCDTAQEKIYAVAKYVAQNVCYDHDYLTHQTKDWTEVYLDPYDVLKYGSSICDGYARATATLLQLSGVPCLYIGSPDHAWNMAYNGERWVMLDTTWMSGGKLEYGVLTKSDSMWMDWFDFTIDQANANENHVITGMSYMVTDGELIAFPKYTAQTDVVIGTAVSKISAEITASDDSIKTITLPETLTSIKSNSFTGSLSTVYYEGTSAEYKKISISSGNSALTGCSNFVYRDNASAPYVKTHPQDTLAELGTKVTLKADFGVKTGTVTYQWYKNTTRSTSGGTAISGAVSKTYSFTPSELGKSYYYLKATVKDTSVKGTQSVYTTTVPCEVHVFEELPTQSNWIGNEVKYFYSDNSGILYIDGSGTIEMNIPVGNCTEIILDKSCTAYYLDSYGSLVEKAGKKLVKFASGSGVTEYIMSDDITAIGDGAFFQASISKVEFSENLKSIGRQAFWNSTLVTAVFPETLTSIGDEAFTYCYRMTDVYFMGNVPTTWGNNVFLNFDEYELVKIHYAHDAENWTTPTWTDKSGVKYIATPYDAEIFNSGYACGDMASWTLSGDTLIISGSGDMWDFDWAGEKIAPWQEFKNSIKKVDVKRGITSIGVYSFYQMPSLTDISLPNTLTKIGHRAFWNTNSIRSVTVPKNVAQIDSEAFEACFGLDELRFEGNVPAVWGNNAVPTSATIYYPAGNESGWTLPTWTAADGNTYSTQTYTPAVSGYDISGTVTAHGSASETVVVSLIDSDGFTVGVVETLDGKYSFTDVEVGEYTIRFEKAGNFTTESSVKITNSAVVNNAVLDVIADVNGDNKLDSSDVTLLTQYFAGYNVTLSTELADVDGNGKVTRKDAMILARHLAGWEGYELPYTGE